MEVEVHCRAEALEEGDGAALLGAKAGLASGAASQLGEQSAQEGAKHVARKAGVVGAAVAERVGQGQHPLADGDHRQHAVDEVGGGVGHAATAAGGAEAAALAREGDDPLVMASVAAHPQEAVRGNAAAKIGAQLLLYETWRRLAAFVGAREEGLEVGGDRSVEHGALGTPRLIGRLARCAGRCDRWRDRRGLGVRHPEPPLREPCRARRLLRDRAPTTLGRRFT